MNDISAFAKDWFSLWQLGLIGSVLLASLGQLLLTRARPDALRVFRNNLVFGSLCLLLGLVVYPFHRLDMSNLASMANELSRLALGLLLIRICGLTAFREILPRMGMNPPAILEDILLVITYFAWGMVRLRAAGVDFTGIVTTSAVITGVIAFSMQETLGNILGGLVLQLDDSVRIGDWISIDGARGKIVEVHWRYTDILTPNGHLIVVPNGMLMKSRVDVYSRAESASFRRWVKFWVSDLIPPQQIIDVVAKALREAQIKYVATSPAPECIVTDYHEGMIEYAVRYWLTDPAHDDGTDSVVRVHFYSALKRQNYALAHPCLDVRMRKESAKTIAAQNAQELVRRKDALKRVKLFAALSPDELTHIASSLRNTPFIKDDVMTKQGAVAHWLYLLIRGEADVWFENPGEAGSAGGNLVRVHVATLKEGDIFGEMGLLTGEPRSATVTARTDVECYRLDKEHFQHILQERPALAGEFAHILCERSLELAALRKEPLPEKLEVHADYLDSIRAFFGLGGR